MDETDYIKDNSSNSIVNALYTSNNNNNNNNNNNIHNK